MNPNIKKRNKSIYKFSNTQIPKIIGNTIANYFHPNNEYNNFKYTVSNITKQLNNMSFNSFPKSRGSKINSFLKNDNLDKSKNIFSNIKNDILDNLEKNKRNSNFLNNLINKDNLFIIHNNSFCISQNITNKSKNNMESELNQENINLKENIKFLLGQIKKYQKNGIIIDENNNNILYNDNEMIIKLKNMISEKEKEIDNIKKYYQTEIKSILEKIYNLESKYENLKKEYNKLQIKHKNKSDYKSKIELDNYNNEIIKLNNSEILENKNKNSNFEIDNKQPFYRNINKYNKKKSNIKIENSKNTEENYYSNKISENKIIFHKSHQSTNFSNNYIIKKDNKDIYGINHNFTNYNKEEKFNYLKLNNDKCLSLNNSFKNEKKNNYPLIKNEKIPKTTKNNNISFLYKKAPIKTEIINNFKNMPNYNNNNYKQSIKKNSLYNYLEENKRTNFQCFKNCYTKNNIHKEDINPKLIRRLSSTLYRKKNNKSDSHIKGNKKLNNSYNNKNLIDKYYTQEDEAQNNNIIIPTPSISFSSVRYSKIEEKNKLPEFIPLPQIDSSPKDLYYFPLFCKAHNNKNNENIVYKFNIDNMKYSTTEYSVNKNSSFNLTYSSTINHIYDIIQSISNGFLMVTGDKTNCFYYYNKFTNNIYDLSNLNYFHHKGALLKIDNNRILCISGINSVNVEMYYIKDNIWINIPKMNCPHCESSYMIYNNNVLFSFFGYDYENKKYINDIEYLVIKNYYHEEKWNIFNINSNFNYNLRNHSIFYRINKENNNTKDIFIVGGYSDCGRNNGLIQVFIEEQFDDKHKFKINFKKYEENKVKVIGNNNIILEKNKNMDNIFLFYNEFNQFYDEENNLFYSYNYDNNFNIHIIDNFTLKHTIYRNKIKKY